MSQHPFNGPAVTQLTDPINIGESPFWDARVGKLFYVDIHDGRVVAYDYKSQTSEIVFEYPGHDLTPIIPTKDPNVMVAGLDKSLVIVKLNDKCAKPELLHTVEKSKEEHRFNDGKADKKGRVWMGTMGAQQPDGSYPHNAGALYTFSKNQLKNPSIPIPTLGISNGLTWNLEGTIFYYIDTVTNEVVQFDYDIDTGSISNRKTVLSTKGMGDPDGMTIDVDGNLWVALWGGGSVIHIDPLKRKLIKRIPIPAKHTTSVAWGGPNIDVLFVTTSYRSLTAQERLEQPGAGALYAVTNLGTQGVLDYQADL